MIHRCGATETRSTEPGIDEIPDDRDEDL